ncbi:MAG TPA: hypothetical protein VJ349_00875, partial [Stellaceae bacterium]|nr:hypothetical protein [Stellaceae bacterium]
LPPRPAIRAGGRFWRTWISPHILCSVFRVGSGAWIFLSPGPGVKTTVIAVLCLGCFGGAARSRRQV